MEINGHREFQWQVSKALELLRLLACEAYDLANRNVVRIREHTVTEVNPLIQPVTIQLAPLTAFHSVTWCAGSIAHEVKHVLLCREGEALGLVGNSLWYGQEAELRCIALQATVARMIGAPTAEVHHLESMNGSHFREARRYW